jgi:D-alanine-D-alanine ligase
MARVGVIFGGRSVEHEVSVRSARTVARALEEAGHEVVALGMCPEGRFLDPSRAERALAGHAQRLPRGGGTILQSVHHLVAAAPEVCFPIIHGTWGEDGTLQGLLEILDLPYVGPGVETSAVAMDKIAAKQVLDAAGVPVVPSENAHRRALDRDEDGFYERCEALGFPLFAKPAVGGSSVGVRKVTAAGDLRDAVEFALRFDDAVLVERGITGRELECAVLGYEILEASRVGEIVPGKDFYDYEDKYVTDGAQLIAPAELPPGVEDHLRELAPRAFAALGGVGLARVDFLLEGDSLEDGTAYVNEVNTLPGFTEISMYPRLWDLTGVPLPALVDRLVDIALRRYHDRHQLDAGIKEFLEGLGGGE